MHGGYVYNSSSNVYTGLSSTKSSGILARLANKLILTLKLSIVKSKVKFDIVMAGVSINNSWKH